MAKPKSPSMVPSDITIARRTWVSETASALIAAYLWICYRTIRWTHENREAVEALWASDQSCILLVWHSRMVIAPVCWPKHAQSLKSMISMSKEGDISAGIQWRFGFGDIRGSSAKKSDPAKDKGGARALRDAIRWLKLGRTAISITPDGPRGPVGTFVGSPPLMARLSGAASVFVGLAVAPHKNLRSWDKTIVPLPFGRGTIVWHVEPPLDKDISPEALEALRGTWIDQLNQVTERAETLLAERTDASAKTGPVA